MIRDAKPGILRTEAFTCGKQERRPYCLIALCIANGTIKEPKHARIGQLSFPFDMQRLSC
jgi:hypothetical protein